MACCNNNQSGYNKANITSYCQPNQNTGNMEKVCIQTKKVFDACMHQSTYENQTLSLSNYNPSTYTAPLTLVSGKSTSTDGILNNPIITPLADNSGSSRIQVTVEIPTKLTFTDANGILVTADATMNIPMDIIMCVPTGSIISPEIVAITNVTILGSGQVVSNDSIIVTACVTIIMKVVADVDVIVPSYGYCKFPPCTDYQQEECLGAFETPIFPSCPYPNC